MHNLPELDEFAKALVLSSEVPADLRSTFIHRLAQRLYSQTSPYTLKRVTMTCLVRALVFCFSFYLVGLACLITKPTLHLTCGESGLLFASDGYLYTKATVQPHVKEKLLEGAQGEAKWRFVVLPRRSMLHVKYNSKKNPLKTGQGHRSMFLCLPLLGKKVVRDVQRARSDAANFVCKW